MTPDDDKWAGLFGDESEGDGDAALSGGSGAPAEGDDYVDPGPPEPAVPGTDDDELHDSEPPAAEETGELTDEFMAIENRFLGELEGEEGPANAEGAAAGPVAANAPPEPPEDGGSGDAPATPPAEGTAAGPVAANAPPDTPEDVSGDAPATPPADETSADELLSEEPPAEEPPAEEPPAEEPPAEEPSAEETAAEHVVDPQPTEEAEAVMPVVPPPPPHVTTTTTAAQRSLAATVEQLSKEQIDERRPSPLWMRFLAGSLVIVISMATATAVSAIAFLADFAEGLGDDTGVLKGVVNRLDAVDGGEPQTIMILGSDIRPGDEAGRSDTTMLLRLDGDRNVISLFSLPRDLKVNIPGVGIDKLNAAYSYGGPKKTLETVRAVTGLEINHVVNVDFNGFAKAVDAIDCVYVDVDRDYFHSNVGVGYTEQYAEIDVSSGYQRLCGLRALEYVRYRHTDNDIVRSARQQDFLREARQKVSPAKLWGDRGEMIDIFTEYTSSDIDDLPTLIEVLKLFIEAREAPVNQIHFEGGFEETYVTASNSQMKQAVKEFLGEDEPAEPAEPAPSGDGGDGGSGKGKGKDKKPEPAQQTPMIDSGPETLAFVELMARRKRMPAYLPTRIPPGTFFDDETRGYQIRLPNEKFDDAYKLVFQKGGQFGVPEYYGVMATEWTDPPILENPSEIREIDGRDYMLFYDAGRLRMVGFTTNQGSYWVSNTLLQTLSEQEMIAIATGMREVKG